MRSPPFLSLVLLGLLQDCVLAQTNDAFANRITLGGASASAVANTAAATSEAGEPSHAGVTPGKSLWWSWTAPASGLVNFSAFGSSLGGGESGKELAVYTGGALTALSEAGSSNDQPAFYYYSGPQGVVDTGPSFNLQVTAGTVYQIALESLSAIGSGAVMLNINQPPTIVSNATAGGTEGVAFSHRVQASNLASAFSASGLPSGLSINPFSGLIAGTPAQTGIFAVSVAATNSAGTGTATLTLTIGSATVSVAAAPVFTVAATLSGTVGVSFNQSLSSSGGAQSYSATGLPPGLFLDMGGATFRGTPMVTGSFPVTITATNVLGTSTAHVTLHIFPPAAHAFSGQVAATGTVGVSFSYALGTSESPTVYAASNLPPGLGLDHATATIKGVPTSAGMYAVPFTAASAGGTSTAVVTITVAAVAAPAPLQITNSAKTTGTVGLSLTYQLLANGNPTGFSASGLPPGLSLNPQTGYITGRPLIPGVFAAMITATDGSSTTSATLTFTISTAAVSAAPTTVPYITSSAGAAGVVGTAFSYSTKYTFSGGSPFGPAIYSAAGLPPGLTISTTTGVISGTPTLAGNYAVSLGLAVTDYYGTTVSGKAVLTVAISASNPAPTLAPVVTSSANVSGFVGGTFSHTLTASDRPTGFTSSGLPPGLSLSAATGAITGTPTSAGVYSVVITAVNAVGSGSATLKLTITDPVSALPLTPRITNSCTASGTVGTSLTFYIQADNSPTSYTASDLPPGLVFNAAGPTISGTPTTAGIFVIPITAGNAGGQSQAWVTFTIAEALAPRLQGYAAVRGFIGSAFSYYPEASNSPASYAASNLPPGLTLNPTSGTVSGTPTVAGTFLVPFSATNAVGTGTATITMTVLGASAPAFSTSSLAVQNGTMGVALSVYFSASNSPTSYTANGLPPGLSYDITTGRISGTPTTAGTFVVPLSATNASGTGTATLTMVIAATAVLPAAPVISSSAAAGGVVGGLLSYTIAATNVPTSFAATGLPAGLSLNAGTGVISGMPAAGIFDVAISATNAGGAGSGTLRLVIAAAPTRAPVISSSAGASAVVNQPFSFPVTASQAPTSFTALGLPAGLTISASTGVISGTPTATGTFTVSLSATNAIGTGTATLVLKTSSVSTPCFTSSAVAEGLIGTPFNYTLNVSPAPNSYSVNSPLPGGLKYYGSSLHYISGTPTEAGTFVIALGASGSSSSSTASLRLSILAEPVSPPLISSSAAAVGYLGANLAYQITASERPTFFTATNLPPGLALDPATGFIFGQPQVTGTFTFGVSATNGVGTRDAVITLTILATPPAPAISSSLVVTESIGTSGVIYRITASQKPTSFTAVGLPPGLSLDPLSGAISGMLTTAGIYSVPISASNAGGAATATVTFKIDPPLVPLVTVDASAEGIVGGLFSFYVSGANIPATYAASGLPAGLFLDTSNGARSIRGKPTVSGMFAVSLTASNSAGTGTAILTLVIAPAPPPPVISNAAAMVKASVGQPGSYSFYFSSSETFGTSTFPSTMAATGLPPGLSFDAESGYVSGTPTTPGLYPVTLSATNSGGTSYAISVFDIAAVMGPTAAPVVTSGLGATGVIGSPFSFTISAANTPTSYAVSGLPPGLSLSPGARFISGTPTTAGNFTVSISTGNGAGTTTTPLRIRIAALASDLPVITRAASIFFDSAPLFPGSLTASGTTHAITASNGPATFAASGLPAGLSLNSTTGVISGSPLIGGTFLVPISATNAAGTASAALTIIASVPALAMNVSAQVLGRIGTSLSYTIPNQPAFSFNSANYYTNFAISFDAQGLPPGLSVNTASGRISGTPTAAGSYPVTISARNLAGRASAVVTFVVTEAVAISPSAPRIVSASVAAAGAVNLPFAYSFWAEGLPASLAASDLPPGLSLSIESGTLNGVATLYGKISGTPLAAGTFPVPISASNAAGTASATATFRIASAANTPAISSRAASSLELGAEFYYWISTAYDAVSFGVAKSYSATNLPPGCILDSASGRISGPPTMTGVYPVTLSVTVGGVTGTAVWTVTVLPAFAPPPTPAITAAAGALAFVGVPFSFPLSAGSTPDVFTANALPVGLIFALSGTSGPGATTKYGTVSGIPTTAGTFTIPVSASNVAGASGAIVTLTVRLPSAGLPYTFAAWQSGNFSAAEIADGFAAGDWDFNGDGTLNLLDYALGRDPRTGLGGSLPSVTRPDADGPLQITFPRDTRESDISYIVEASGDLDGWTPIASSVHGAVTANLGGASAVSETGDTVRSVTVQDEVAAGMGPRFLRLKITRP